MYTNVIIIFLDNYEYGLKLMYKLNKNSNLHSEVEERGRGQRLKVKAKRSLDQYYSSPSDDDYDILLKDKPTPYPAFPKKQKSKLNFLKKTILCFLLHCLIYFSLYIICFNHTIL